MFDPSIPALAIPINSRKQEILRAEAAFIERVRTEARFADRGVYIFGTVPLVPLPDDEGPNGPVETAVRDLSGVIDPFF